jgi:hypothetical protein
MSESRPKLGRRLPSLLSMADACVDTIVGDGAFRIVNVVPEDSQFTIEHFVLYLAFSLCNIAYSQRPPSTLMVSSR